VRVNTNPLVVNGNLQVGVGNLTPLVRAST